MPWMGTKTFVIDPNSVNGKYNFGDLNRVNTNIQYLKDAMVSYGYPVTLSQPVITSYSRTVFPKVTDINYTRQNILDLLAGFYPVSAPAVAVNSARKQLFGYIEANTLELNLQAINILLENLAGYFKYAGTFTCGQEHNYL